MGNTRYLVVLQDAFALVDNISTVIIFVWKYTYIYFLAKAIMKTTACIRIWYLVPS